MEGNGREIFELAVARRNSKPYAHGKIVSIDWHGGHYQRAFVTYEDGETQRWWRGGWQEFGSTAKRLRKASAERTAAEKAARI